jgi:hypothetical protein
MPRPTIPSPRSPAAPAPTPESLHEPNPPPEPAPTAREGREANGRFTKGNRGGPGNPFARQTAAFRKHLLEAVTKEDMDAICTILIWRARGGSVPHIKLLFSYLIGKPTDVVNPDTLDRQEMEQYRQELGMEELVCAVGRALTPEVACTLVQAVRPVIMSHIGNALADQLLEGVPPEYLHPESDPSTGPNDEPAPPSPNGEIDAAEAARAVVTEVETSDDGMVVVTEMETRDQAPSANGFDGEEAPPAAAVPPPSANGFDGDEAPPIAAAPAPHGNGPKRPGETERANPARPRPRPVPSRPSARPETTAPPAAGPDRRSVPREGGPARPGAPPPGRHTGS